MSIKFVCSCGKHLRARDDMAARRVLCPRCRSLVGVPSRQPTHRGTDAAPMTPQERLRHVRHRAPVPSSMAAAPVDEALVEAPPSPDPDAGVALRQKPRRQREARWYHCLAYPCRAWPLVLVLGLAWAGWAGGSVALLPVVQDLPGGPERLWLPGAAWLFLTLVLAGYTWGFLDCTLIAAATGEVAWVRWPGRDPLLVFRSVARWLIALLAGPVLLFAVAFSYWLYGGDLGALDWLIVAELAAVAAAWWVFAVAAAGERERFRDVNPVAVARLVYRLGYGGLVVLAAGVVAVGHGWLVLAALEGLRHVPTEPAPQLVTPFAPARPPIPDLGSLLGSACVLLLAGVSAVFLTTFLFRLVGMWCFRSRPAAAPDAQPG
jgi:hypothetical protein